MQNVVFFLSSCFVSVNLTEIAFLVLKAKKAFLRMFHEKSNIQIRKLRIKDGHELSGRLLAGIVSGL